MRAVDKLEQPRRRIGKMLAAGATLTALLVGSIGPAKAETIDFMSLKESDGILMLTKGSQVTFIACWSTRSRTYMYASVNRVWREVARAHIVRDNSGTCDIDFPYLHSYTWTVDIVPKKRSGSRTLVVGLGTTSNPRPAVAETFGIYANYDEASEWLRGPTNSSG